MTTYVRKRPWFADAHGQIAGVVAACVMRGEVPPFAAEKIAEQLERAYRRGVADAKAGRQMETV
jgi:hypothetical protein